MILSALRRRLSASRALMVPAILLTAGLASSPAARGAGLAESLLAEPRETLLADIGRAGDAGRGAIVFHTAHLACLKCHAVDTGPAPLGPDLASLPEDIPPDGVRSHLVDALLEPSKRILPAYRGVAILTDSGASHAGILARESAEEVVLRDAAAPGGEVAIPTGSIEERRESDVSLMPAGLPNLLAGRGEFLDLVAYLEAIAEGGPERARALAPDPALVARSGPADYERDIDHAGFIGDLADPEAARQAFERGAATYARVCANCHGTPEAPGSLPTAPRFATHRFKAGSDPLSLYRTLTVGVGQMVPQGWMVPSQKYDVIHYLRETFLRERSDLAYVPVTPDYLAGLPRGSSRGPAPAATDPWRLHDYGPFLAATIEPGREGRPPVRKGFAVRLDPGGEGIGRGRDFAMHDLDTLALAAWWRGDGFIDWEGINFDGRHGAWPHSVGTLWLAAREGPGWADPDTGSFDDPRPLGRDGRPFGPVPWSRMRSVHHAGDAMLLDFRVGDAAVLETLRLEPVSAAAAPAGTDGDASRGPDGARVPVLTRSFSFGPRPRPLVARIAPDSLAAVLVSPTQAGGAGGGVRLEAHDGFWQLSVPAGGDLLDVAVAIAPAPPATLAAATAALAAPPRAAAAVGTPSRTLWPEILATRVARGGDEGPIAVDRLATPDHNPWNAQLRLSGLDYLDPAGDTAAVCTWDGDVWRVAGLRDPGGSLAWKRIASGLFQPLGLKVVGGSILVGCRDRIVRLVDLDGDGQTDRYDTVNDDHQVTEHFHEFAMGLETDAAGNLYYAKSARHALPAVVPHHGTLIKVSPDGATTEILARGFRAANGVCVEPDGSFWVTDQEGHWNPKNRINHVRPGGFYGNMFGYHDVTDPSDDAMEPPALWITNAFDRSPAELLRVPAGTWEPLEGSLLELSYGEGRVQLVLTEPVPLPRDPSRTVLQGGMTALPIADLPTGVMRGRFNPGDGALYACGLFAWAGNRTEPGGMFRIRRTRTPLVVPRTLHAGPGTIVLSFTESLDRAAAEDPSRYAVRTWGLRRSADYGSPHLDETDRPVTSAVLSPDGRTVTLAVDGFASTRCYALEWRLESAAGPPAAGSLHGTVH